MAELNRAQFGEEIQARSPEPLPNATLEVLHAHYRLLLRWNELTSLVGASTLPEALDLHYGESLASLPLLDRTPGKILVDVGSGAGFPGFVLAAARPEMHVILLEARERKWSFLKVVAGETGVAVECLLGTLDRTLPKGFPARVDYVTLRAVKLPPRSWHALEGGLASEARVLVWAGRDNPPLAPTLRIAREVPLSGSASKRILVIERSHPGGDRQPRGESP